VEKIREEPARFSQWLSHHVPNKARHSKVDVKTYKEMSSAEQRLVEVLQDPASLRLFLKAVTLLRMVFPYDSDFGNDKTPLEFAKEKRFDLSVMEGIRISPATQSFRRHLVGVTGRDGKETWFEIKIPGRDEGRDQSLRTRWMLRQLSECLSGAQGGHCRAARIVDDPGGRGWILRLPKP